MARGKHKARANGRRKALHESTIAQLRAELELESASLADAEILLQDIAHAQGELEAQTAALIDETAPFVARLREERDFLRSAFASASGHHDRIVEAWDHYADKVIDMIPGTNLQKVETFARLVGINGYLTDGPTSAGKNLSQEQVTKIQRARGLRRNASDVTHDYRLRSDLSILIDIDGVVDAGLRPRLREAVFDAGIAVRTEGHALARIVDESGLDENQLRVRDEAILTAERVMSSHAADLNPDAVYVWGTGSLLALEDGESGVFDALGVTPIESGSAPAEHELSVLASPLPSTPAATRAALGRRDPAEVFDSWKALFASRQRVANVLGLDSHPFAPISHQPQPSQGLALQHIYAKSAFARWLRHESSAPHAHVALGMATAANYWLPAGQTASFAESEPLTDTDRAELILPFPQVFLAFAEPLLIERSVTPSEASVELWKEYSSNAHSARTQDANFKALLDSRVSGRRDKTVSVPRLGDVIHEYGASVEGVLLLADPYGRPDDLFAWCLTVNGAYGATLGRFAIPARRSLTRYRDVVDNLTAVVSWAQWHEPDENTVIPVEIGPGELESIVNSTEFRRNAKRSGAGVRVVNVRATHRDGKRSSKSDGESGAQISPHIRRGHWRRQRYGAGNEQVKRIRIAPVLVNAHRGDIAHRIYRLPAAAAPAKQPTEQDA